MRMLTVKETAQIFGVSTGHLYRMIGEQKFPKGKKIGGSTRWLDELVEAYTIAYWGLERPYPKLTEQEQNIIDQCLQNARIAL